MAGVLIRASREPGTDGQSAGAVARLNTEIAGLRSLTSPAETCVYRGVGHAFGRYVTPPTERDH